MITWIKDSDIVEGGDVGGDYQMTRSWTARFRRADDPCRMITVYAYGELPKDRWAAFDAWEEANVEPVVVSLHIELMVCTDPKDPGSSEVWSDSRYHLAVYPAGGTVSQADAEAEAKKIVEAMGPDHPALNGDHAWDGLAPFERG